MKRDTLFFILAGIIIVSGIWLYFNNQNKVRFETEVCPLDAMICPDGTTLTRIPPSCEFPECPKESASESTDGLEELDDFLFQQESIE